MVNLSQAIIKKSLKRVNSDCISFGVLESSEVEWWTQLYGLWWTPTSLNNASHADGIWREIMTSNWFQNRVFESAGTMYRSV